MTLAQVIDIFEKVAMQQPSVNMIVRNDVFRINSSPSLKYGIFAWTQGQHTGNINGMTTFSFTFFYVDRLKENQSNQIEIQSVGIQTLDNIIRQLDDLGIYSEMEYTFQVFNQRFPDECAGVFCNVNLSVPVGSVCPETFEDFNADFNEDFMIY